MYMQHRLNFYSFSDAISIPLMMYRVVPYCMTCPRMSLVSPICKPNIHSSPSGNINAEHGW